jgi:hypothetical protein
MKHTRIEMQSWYYEELIRRGNKMIDRWLNDACAPKDLQDWATNFPKWVNGTILTGGWPKGMARILEWDLSELATRLEHHAKVDAMMAKDPGLAKLGRREAAAVADTSHMPPGEPVLIGPFQLERTEQPTTWAWTEPF